MADLTARLCFSSFRLRFTPTDDARRFHDVEAFFIEVGRMGRAISMAKRTRPLAVRAADLRQEIGANLTWSSLSDIHLDVDFHSIVPPNDAPPSCFGTYVQRKSRHPVYVAVVAGPHWQRYVTEPGGDEVDVAELVNSSSGAQQFSMALYPHTPTADGVLPFMVLDFTVEVVNVAPRGAVIDDRLGKRTLSLLTSNPTSFHKSFHEYVVIISIVDLELHGISASRARETQIAVGFELCDALWKRQGASISLRTAYVRPVAHSDGGVRCNFESTSWVILSSGSLRQGQLNSISARRMVSARFKVDDNTGLCKESDKCRLVPGIVRSSVNSTTGVATELSPNNTLNIARDILNHELFPDEGTTFSVTFAYGETLRFRVQRRCLCNSDLHRSPLVETAQLFSMSFSYDRPSTSDDTPRMGPAESSTAAAASYVAPERKLSGMAEVESVSASGSDREGGRVDPGDVRVSVDDADVMARNGPYSPISLF